MRESVDVPRMCCSRTLEKDAPVSRAVEREGTSIVDLYWVGCIISIFGFDHDRHKRAAILLTSGSLFRGLTQLRARFRTCLHLPWSPHQNRLEQHRSGHRT
jgi:hypothetical protein